MRNILVVVLLSGCPGEWASESEGLRQPLTFCLASKGSDVVAKGRLISAAPPRVLTYTVWPGRHNTTPISVEVVKDLRGRLSPGVYSMFVGAPISLDGREIETFHKTQIGQEGWLYASLIEGKWIFGLDGLVTSDPSSSRYETRLGSFEREADFEAAQIAAFTECPRVDSFADDGGRASWAGPPGTNGQNWTDAGP